MVCWRGSAPETKPGPIGRNPWPPFPRNMEPASVSRKSCSPMSSTGTKPAMQSHASSARMLRAGLPMTAANSPSQLRYRQSSGFTISPPWPFRRRRRLQEVGRSFGWLRCLARFHSARRVGHMRADYLLGRTGRQVPKSGHIHAKPIFKAQGIARNHPSLNGRLIRSGCGGARRAVRPLHSFSNLIPHVNVSGAMGVFIF